MPEIIGYDPTGGLGSVEKAGQSAINILAEAHRAQAGLIEQRRQRAAMDYLSNTIKQRNEETGGKAGMFPLYDPKIIEAATTVQGVIPDMVKSLSDIHDANSKRIAPTPVSGGYVKFNPNTFEYDFVPTETKDGETKNPVQESLASIFGKNPSLVDISTISHLGDKDIYQVDPETKQPVVDDQGQPVIDKIKLAGKVMKDQVGLAGAKAGAGAAAREDVTGPVKEKEDLKKKEDAYGTAVAKLKNKGYSEAEIAEILTGQTQMTLPNGGIAPKPRFRDTTKPGSRAMKPEIDEAVSAFSALPKDVQDAERQRFQSIAPPAGDGVPAPASGKRSLEQEVRQ